jgi:hypothetical protein
VIQFETRLLKCGDSEKIINDYNIRYNNILDENTSDCFTRQNTLRRHLHVIGLSNSPTCRKCGTEEETSTHILCECEALASHSHMHLASFFLDLEDIRVLGVGAIWNCAKGTGLL